jgi:hypothetical protein
MVIRRLLEDVTDRRNVGVGCVMDLTPVDYDLSIVYEEEME